MDSPLLLFTDPSQTKHLEFLCTENYKLFLFRQPEGKCLACLGAEGISRDSLLFVTPWRGKEI
jgi:hypothetical protein